MKLSEGLYSSISHSTRKEYLGDCFWLFTWKLVSVKGAEKKNEQEKISGSEEQEKVQKNRYGWTIRCLQALRMVFMFPAKSLVCGCLFMKQAFKSLLKLMEVKRLCLLILLFLLLSLHLMSFNKHISWNGLEAYKDNYHHQLSIRPHNQPLQLSTVSSSSYNPWATLWGKGVFYTQHSAFTEKLCFSLACLLTCL